MFFADIGIAVLTVVAFLAVFYNVLHYLLTQLKMFFVYTFSHCCDGTAKLVTTNPWIGIIAFALEISDIIGADTGGFYFDQYFVFFNGRCFYFLDCEITWFI